MASDELIPDETLFLINSLEPWYGDIIFYLKTQTFRSDLSNSECRCIRHQSQPYRIIDDTWYRVGVDSILCRCLTPEEAKRVLNVCHSGACGVLISGYATTQKILHVGYLWPSIFKYCILAIQKCHAYQIYNCKQRTPPTPLHQVIIVGPFAKWGIGFMTCNPHSSRGHSYIIVVVDYFTKWAKEMPTYVANAIWDYQTTAKTATRFTPFQLVYHLKATLTIECEIPSLKLVVELLPNTSPEEERLLYLERLDEARHITVLVIKAQKKRVKDQYNKNVSPYVFAEGDLVLLYDQANVKLGAWKFEPMWHGPYIIK
eukprot:PITA_12155